VTLTDAGPLVALTIVTDPDHARCAAALRHLPYGPLLTTWPCLTEAMHIVFRSGGVPAQRALWRMWSASRLIFHDLTTNEVNRMQPLMDQYRNVPMDLADASLVAAAETRGIRTLFTLDSDFFINRLMDGSTFQLIP
jgi:uncharacterized protein